MSPASRPNDKTCAPVKVNIAILDCKTNEKTESTTANAKFICRGNPPELKYWFKDAMLIAELEKTKKGYEVRKQYALDYEDKKHPQVITPIVAALPVKNGVSTLPEKTATNLIRSSITLCSFHGITLPLYRKKCNLCVRNEVLPMSRVAQNELLFLTNFRLSAPAAIGKTRERPRRANSRTPGYPQAARPDLMLPRVAKALLQLDFVQNRVVEASVQVF